jgi:hypothetical protein
MPPSVERTSGWSVRLPAKRLTGTCCAATCCPPSGQCRWPTWTRWRSGPGWPSWSAKESGRARGPSPTACCRASWARPSRAATCPQPVHDPRGRLRPGGRDALATVAEVAALADAIPPRFRALVLVAAYTGLRWGELAGLRVKRVDLLHRQITVAEQLLEVRGAACLRPAQDRRWPADRDPANRRGRGAGRAPEPLCRGRPGRAGVPGRTGWADPAQQLHPPRLDPGHPERPGSRDCAFMTCGTPQRPWRSLPAPAPGS